MSQAKKARLSDFGQHDLAIGCQLDKETVIALTPVLGTISAISAWAPVGNPAALDVHGSTHQSLSYIAIGTDAGCVMLVDNNRNVTKLEDCGGPPIQCMLIRDAAATAPMAAASTGNARSSSLPDIVACDSDGRVSVYTDRQMFARNVFSAPISAISLETNANSPSCFIVGDLSGAVSAIHAQEVLWRAHVVTHERNERAECLRPQAPAAMSDPGIAGVCSVQFLDNYGILTSYVLAVAGECLVQVISRGHPVLAVPTPSPCLALAAGRFVSGDAVDTRSSQAMVGDETGMLFVLDNFELIPYAQLDYPVTRVVSIPLRAFLGQRDGLDVVVCATRSNMVYVLHNKQVVCKHAAAFWPAAMDVVGTFFAANPCIVIAENSIEAGKSCAKSVHVIPIAIITQPSTP